MRPVPPLPPSDPVVVCLNALSDGLEPATAASIADSAYAEPGLALTDYEVALARMVTEGLAAGADAGFVLTEGGRRAAEG
jgi:hypothetical protein